MRRWIVMGLLSSVVLVSACAEPFTNNAVPSTAAVSSSTEAMDAPDSPPGSDGVAASPESSGSTAPAGFTASTAEGTPPTSAGSASASDPKPTAQDPPVDSGLTALVQQARSDLAGRLGVSESNIALVSAQTTVWPDSSLGCPRPGMAYAQVMTDGSLIVLSADGIEYNYHTGGSRVVPFLCEAS